MASNELEVLDPAATVANLQKSASGRALNRRNFMTTALGVAGAASGAALVSGRSRSPQTVSAATAPNQGDVLNYLLNLEYLQATFYSYITQGTDLPTSLTAGSGGISGYPYTFNATTGLPVPVVVNTTQQITDLLNEIYFDELNHVIELRNILGAAAINRPSLNLSAYVPLQSTNALSIARFLEDLIVTAYNGVATLLTGSNLTYVAEILATESFHCGAIRLLNIQNPTIAPYAVAGTSVSFRGSTVAGSPTITNVYINTTGATTLEFYPAGQLLVGQYIEGPGIPIGTTIVSAQGSNVTTITGTVTLNSNIVSVLTSTTGIMPGQVISGTGIPNGTIVQAITSSTTITISAFGTATNTKVALAFGAGTVTISAPANASATGAGTTGIIFLIYPDTTMDVQPFDPGSAALAAAGPAAIPGTSQTLIPGSSSTLYGGFFDTAGAATASSQNPAGFAFTRTPSQALSVLYSPSTNNAVTPGTASGGFFGSGLNGTINTI